MFVGGSAFMRGMRVNRNIPGAASFDIIPFSLYFSLSDTFFSFRDILSTSYFIRETENGSEGFDRAVGKMPDRAKGGTDHTNRL